MNQADVDILGSQIQRNAILDSVGISRSQPFYIFYRQAFFAVFVKKNYFTNTAVTNTDACPLRW
jgi:hypothetical protein